MQHLIYVFGLLLCSGSVSICFSANPQLLCEPHSTSGGLLCVTIADAFSVVAAAMKGGRHVVLASKEGCNIVHRMCCCKQSQILLRFEVQALMQTNEGVGRVGARCNIAIDGCCNPSANIGLKESESATLACNVGFAKQPNVVLANVTVTA